MGFGPVFAQKNVKYLKSNCIFHSKLKPDRAFIFAYSESPMDKFSRANVYFFWFCTPSWGKLGQKLDQKRKLWVHPAVVEIQIFWKVLHDSYIFIRTISGQNFSLIWLHLPELLPKQTPNFGPIVSQTPKNSGFRKGKLRTTNTQKLKVVDPETMGGWSYYRLIDTFCGPFGLAPRGNLWPIFQIGPKRTNKFQGLASFCNN